MSHELSFQSTVMPSAVLADPPVMFVPLFAVTQISISETYYLPPLGTSRERMIIPAHDDTVTLSALLVGDQRFIWKTWLETMADISKRGGVLGSITGGYVGGLVLVTSMTVRTDMQIQTLSFTANAQRREVIEVQISMAHVPRPNPVARVLDLLAPAVGGLADWSK